MDAGWDTELIEDLFETVDDGLFAVDDGEVCWGNEAFHEIVGDLAGSGESFIELLGEFGIDRLAEDPDPTAIRTRRGRDAPLEVQLERLEDGRYVGRVGGSRPTDTRARTLERYRTVLDTVEDAVYMTDEERRFTWVNAAVEPMFGYDREELIGTHLFEFLDDEQIEASRENVRYLLDEETPETITFEMEITRKDGTTVPVETRASLLPGEGFAGTVGVIRDVTERKERREALERKNERLDEFARIVSHDLRNPLHVAEGRLGLLREEYDPEHLDEMETALERMRFLIDDLMLLAQSGESLLETETVDLAEAVHDSWRTVETGTTTLVEETEFQVEADDGQLRRLLENLVRNAIEHADADTVVVGDLDGEPGFFVEDDGPGIPESERENVVRMGYSAAGGMGLGLAIVDEVVDAHGWDLRITEGSDGGARFEIATGE